MTSIQKTLLMITLLSITAGCEQAGPKTTEYKDTVTNTPVNTVPDTALCLLPS